MSIIAFDIDRHNSTYKPQHFPHTNRNLFYMHKPIHIFILKNCTLKNIFTHIGKLLQTQTSMFCKKVYVCLSPARLLQHIWQHALGNHRNHHLDGCTTALLHPSMVICCQQLDIMIVFKILGYIVKIINILSASDFLDSSTISFHWIFSFYNIYKC